MRCIILGGGMKTKTKGIYAAIGFIVSIGIYYFLSLGIEWFWSDICAKHYCMKTLSLAEFLAIEAALIGVYFVVSSIDDWKKEDQYQTAKKNIIKLHSIYKKLEIYNVQLARLENSITSLYVRIDKKWKNETTQLFSKYKSWLSDLEIDKEIKEANYFITQQSKNLYQEDFENLINLLHDYITTIDRKLKAKDTALISQQTKDLKPIREEYENKIKGISDVDKLQEIMKEFAEKSQAYKQNLTQNDIDLIHTQEHSKFDKYEQGLNELQKKINNFLD